MKRKSFTFLSFLIFTLFISIGYSQEYEMPSFIDAMTSYDFDSDGFNDIIVSCPYSDTIVIMFNDGMGDFILFYYNRVSSGFIISGLIDNDTLPDILTRSVDGISFLKNLGQRNLSDNQTIYNIEGGYYVTVIKDMNLDDYNDLIYTNTYPECWGILKNNGDLNFTSKFFHSGSPTSEPYAGFLDIDSLPDIVLSYNALNKSSAYLNNANFNFTEVILEDYYNSETPIMNLDNDGPDDISLVSYDASNINLFKYIGNEQFELKSDFSATGTYDIAGFLADDFNQDGFDDFAIIRCSWTNCTDSIYIYINNQEWSFYHPQQYFVGSLYFFKFYSTDLNGDTFPDIYMKGYSENSSIKILWNNGDGSFSYENPVKINEEVIKPVSLITYPNPFRLNLNIEIQLNEPEDIEINIIDLYGNRYKIFNLSDKAMADGYTILWDGCNMIGNTCPPGLYIIKANVNDYQIANKVIKLK